ncbi:hypothetical protein G7Y89_g13001 [Cudoniella acicularis]|uniref:Mid2 domain-containing protein n=1 Tax=Cudoniella acicularis TaxID=354080 RepID=A0A8H4R9C8_9HELO|nr:hypothetical protein G7Y89_g13001 [Cudoniella acicularis]
MASATPTMSRPPSTNILTTAGLTITMTTSYLPITTAHPYQSACNASNAIWAIDGMVASNNWEGYAYDIPFGMVVNTSVKCQPDAATASWVSSVYSVGGQVFTYGMHNPTIDPVSITYVPANPSITNQVVMATTTVTSNWHMRVAGIGGYVFDDVVTATAAASTSPTTIQSSSGKVLVTATQSSAGTGAFQNSTQTGLTTSTLSSTLQSSSQTAFFGTITSQAQVASNLSPGAKVGLGIGIAVGILGFIALIVAVYLLRFRRQKTISGDDSSSAKFWNGMTPGIQEVDGNAKWTSEMGGNPMSEVYG